MASRFTCVEDAPPVEMFTVLQEYKNDTNSNKVDLGLGAYKTDEGKPWVLPVVRKIEKAVAKDDTLNHEYLPATGLEEFTKAATRLLLGESSPALKENRALGVQTISGTGGLRVGSEFLSGCAGFKNIYIPSPTWLNHHYLFSKVFQNCHNYRYWKASKKNLDFEGMLEDLEAAPEDSVILLQACAHNPTGVDPTQEQWKKIADLMKRKKLFPFFDCAYQGFASGNLERDSWSVRYFVSRGFELLCAQSFAKNMGLYDERAGNLTLVFKDAAAVNNCREQISLIIENGYFSPPCYGVRIVARILNDPKLFKEWQNHLKEMSGRIILMRKTLKQKLDELKTPGTWDHITNQIGMFSYTGLSQKQVKYLTEEYHIYMSKTSRICICGLNTKNVEYVALAIHDAVMKFADE